MGKEFIELFEEWAKTYDDTVTGHDEEYKDVFLYYDQCYKRWRIEQQVMY